jgi:hypothetical protein
MIQLMFRTAYSTTIKRSIASLVSVPYFSFNLTRNASSIRTYCLLIPFKCVILSKFKQSLPRKFSSSQCIYIETSTAKRTDAPQYANSNCEDSINRVSVPTRKQSLDSSTEPLYTVRNKRNQMSEEDAQKVINSFSPAQKSALLTIQREFELLRV